jgi:hypothetical protein
MQEEKKSMTSLISSDLNTLEETAHAVGQVIKATPGLGEAIHETLQHFWTDRVRFARRKRNLEREFQMAEEMMKGQKRLEDISTVEAERILAASAPEDREAVQKLWAAMIARLLTGDLPTLRAEWIEIIQQLEVIDAGILDLLPKVRNNGPQGDHRSFINELSSEFLRRWSASKVEYNDFWLSLKSLENRGLLTYRGTLQKKPDGSWPPSWEFTPLGLKIVEITTPP